MNTVEKGRRRQREARKKLEDEGWQVICAKRSSKYDHEIDFYGLFDLCAYKDGYFRWIQVKSNVCRKEVREKIKKFLTDGVFVTREIWVYEDWYARNPIIEVVR